MFRAGDGVRIGYTRNGSSFKIGAGEPGLASRSFKPQKNLFKIMKPFFG